MENNTAKSGKKRKLGRPPGSVSTRDKIIEGAMVAFGEMGYQAASIEDVLEAADVSRRTFYRFFRSKDDIFSEVSSQAFKRLINNVMESLDPKQTGLKMLENGIDTFIRSCVEAGAFARVLLMETFPPGSEYYKRREAGIEQTIRLFSTGYKQLDRKPVDPMLVRGLIAALEHIGARLAIKANVEEVDFDRAKRVMLRMMAATLAEEGEFVPEIPRDEDDSGKSI